jgi:hypothetical protein
MATPDDYHAHAVIRVFSMQPDQMGGKFIARSALRITEDQEDALAAVFLERNRAALEIRQVKNRRRSAGFEPASTETGKNDPAVKHGSAPLASHTGFDSQGGGQTFDDVPEPNFIFDKKSREAHSVRPGSFGDWTLAGKLAALGRAHGGPGSFGLLAGQFQGERKDPICSPRYGRRHSPFFIQQVCYGRAFVLERPCFLRILHQQDGALQAVLGRPFLVRSGLAAGKEH